LQLPENASQGCKKISVIEDTWFKACKEKLSQLFKIGCNLLYLFGWLIP
jgi:hypothetical protein